MVPSGGPIRATVGDFYTDCDEADGQRHTRWRERDLVSIACSTLQIPRQRVHVPRLPSLPKGRTWKAELSARIVS